MKNELKYLYVVEGKTDLQKLKDLGLENIIITNGFLMVSQETKFIKHVLNRRKVIIITDPDGPGKRITHLILEKLDEMEKESVIVAELNKKQSIKKGKVGLAQTDKEYLLTILKDYIVHDKNIDEVRLTIKDLVDHGFLATERKKEMMRRYDFVSSGNKAFLNRLNYLGLTKEDLAYEKNG